VATLLPPRSVPLFRRLYLTDALSWQLAVLIHIVPGIGVATAPILLHRLDKPRTTSLVLRTVDYLGPPGMAGFARRLWNIAEEGPPRNDWFATTAIVIFTWVAAFSLGAASSLPCGHRKQPNRPIFSAFAIATFAPRQHLLVVLGIGSLPGLTLLYPLYNLGQIRAFWTR